MAVAVSETEVREALQAVQDPELRRSIVDLEMVRAIRVAGPAIAVDIALTIAGCPLSARIRDDVETVLGRLPGVGSVEINLSVMNDEERRKAFQRAFGRRGDEAPKASRAPAEIPVRAVHTPAATLLDRGTSTRLVGVASGKGGVGKSTVTANLAVALARRGAKVGLMDLDVYGFSQGTLFGVSDQPETNEDGKIIPWTAHGVSVVSTGMFVPPEQAVMWRGPMLGKIMDQFFTDVAWGPLDYLVVDLPPGTGDVALNMAQRVGHAGLVLVTTPEAVAAQVARRTATMAATLHQTLLGVIENMSYLRCPHGDVLPVFGEGGGQRLAHTLGVPLLGKIPLDPEVGRVGGSGAPVVARDPESESALAFLVIADRLRDLTQ